MIDNILNVTDIKEIDKRINYQSDTLNYLENLLFQHPDSFYLKTLVVYFDSESFRSIELSTQLENIENTYAKLGVSIHHLVKHHYDLYIAFVRHSIELDLTNLNRWSKLEYYNYLLDADTDEAFEYYKAVMALYPDFLHLQLAKSNFDCLNGNGEVAINELIQFETTYKTNNSNLFFAIGNCHLSLFRTDEAKVYFEKALLNFENPYAYNGLSEVDFYEYKYESARIYSQKAIDIRPNEADFCWRHAINLSVMLEPELAFVYFEKAISNSSDSKKTEQYFISYIDTLVLNGEYEKAFKKHEAFKELNGSIFFKTKYDIIFSYFLDDNFNEAVSKLNAFKKDFPDLYDEIKQVLFEIGVDLRL